MKKYLTLALAAFLALGATTAFAATSYNGHGPCVRPDADEIGLSNYESCMAAYDHAYHGGALYQSVAMRHAEGAMETRLPPPHGSK